MKYDATKTVKRVVDEASVLSVLRDRTRSQGELKKASPLTVKGFNQNMGGACQVSTVTFTTRVASDKTVITAHVNQGLSLVAWLIAIVGIFFGFIPTIAVALWLIVSKSFVQRDIWRILDEVGEE